MIKISYKVDGQEFSHELADGHYIVGRSKSCDIVIREASISGQHVRLDVENGKVSFRDLLSRNGTMIDGARKSQGELRNGMSVRLGHVDVKFFSDAPASPSEEFAPPPPAVSGEFAPPPAPADALAPAPAVFQAPAVTAPAETAPVGAQPSRRPILYAIAGVVLLMVIGLCAAAQFAGGSPKPTKKIKVDADEKYWKMTNQGADLFTVDSIAAAIDAWDKAEAEYKKRKSGEESPNIAKTFSQIAQPFTKNKAAVEKADWAGATSRIASLMDNNAIPYELEGFAQQLSKRCRSEKTFQLALIEANKLREERKWEEALAKYREIPQTCVYYNIAQESLTGTESDRLQTLKADADNAARAEKFEDAIKFAEEFLSRGGNNEKLRDNISKWKETIKFNQERQDAFSAAESASTNAEIDSAVAKIEEFKKSYPNNAPVVKLDAQIKELRQKQFIAKLNELYRTGDSEGLKKHYDSGDANFRKAITAEAVYSRWQQVSEKLKAAEEAEKAEKFGTAIDLWKQTLIIEPDAQNRFNNIAKAKIEMYPPEVLGQKLLDRARKAVDEHQFRNARTLLNRAAEYQTDTKELVNSMTALGKRLYNEGVNAWNQEMYSEAQDKLNDAIDCFQPGDEMYIKIDRWMTRNEVKRRK